MDAQPTIGDPARTSGSVSLAERRVWLDVTGSILWHSGPLSPLGADVLRRAMVHLQRAVVRVSRDPADPRNLMGVFDRRVWLNLSALRGYLSGASVQRWVGEVEPSLVGHIRDQNLPATDDLRVPEVLPGLMFQGARAMASAVAGQLQPKRSAASATAAWSQWLEVLKRRAAHPIDDRGVVAWVDHILSPTAALVADELMPRIALATTASRAIREPFMGRSDCAPLLDAVTRGIGGHRVTTFMGLEPSERCARFGHWGPGALDVHTPQDGLRASADRSDPRAFRRAFEQARQARRLAVSTLASELHGPLERARFLAAADVVDSLGGLSDWPLDALLHCLDPIRKRLWQLAEASTGALDLADWGALTLSDLERIHGGDAPENDREATLPGTNIRSLCPVTSGVLVAGPFEGMVVDVGTKSPVAPSETIWRAEHLDMHLAERLTACAGILVARDGAYGPAGVLAAAIGRPCVSVPRGALPEPGRWVRVDRAGRITAIKGQGQHPAMADSAGPSAQ